MRRFLIVVESARENFSAYAPDLPGCVATGETRAEARQLMREAIECHLQGLALDGLPAPEPAASAEYVEVPW